MGDDYRVLHVDDDADFAELTAEYLERENGRFQIETVMSAEEGIDTLDQNEVDCIISDYDMPNTNGIEFLESIRADHPNLPFILFTGKGTEEIASRAISAGVTDYLQKEGGADQFTVLANRIENAVSKYRTEQKLDTTRRQYQKVTEQNLAGIYLIQDGEFVYVNPTLADIHGYGRETVLGMSPLELVAPEERDRVQKNLQRRLDKKAKDIHYETVGLTKDGDRIDIELHGSQITYNGRPAVIGTVLDITERKERERELKQTKRRLDLALQEANAGTWEWNLDTDELYWSRELLDILGISTDEFDGEIDAFEKRLHPDDVDRVEAEMNNTIETGEPYQVEQRIENANGEYVWLDVRGQLVEKQDSTLMVGIGIDITERKEQQAQLHKQRDRLDEFASVVSHDLRNPLHVAQGQLELAQEECGSEYLDAVERAHERMERLITDLLTLARHGDAVTDLTSVDVAELVENYWQNVQTADVTLVADLDQTVRADRSRLGQLFENLIRNAVEHGDDTGTVTVGELDDGFYVEDDGPGIPPGERDDVFDAGYSTNEAGTGFGLRIVKQVVQAHDWDIRLTESSDGGVRFEITGVELADE